MKIGDEPSFVGGVPMFDESVEMVRNFPTSVLLFLVMVRHVDDDVTIRIAKAVNAFGCLKKSIFTNNCISINIAVKCAVYKAVKLTTLLYGCEWRLIKYASWKCSATGAYAAFWVYLDISNGLSTFLIMNCQESLLSWYAMYCRRL